MAERTLPPVRNTTGTTTVAYGGMSPIDAYRELIDRPLAYIESTTAATTSITAITNAYFKQTIVAGLSHSIGGAAGHFQTNCSGAMVGKIGGVGSWVQLEDGMTGYAGGLDVTGVITPLNVGVRCSTGSTVTLTNAMVVFGMHAQFIQQGTGTPTYLFFARLNTTSTITALFYAESIAATGWVAGTKATACGSIPLMQAHGTPTGAADEIVWVNVYRA